MTKTIALAGNPNVGKSTLFNSLTGSRQHVATKLLEENQAIVEVLTSRGAPELIEQAKKDRESIEKDTGEDAETLIAEQRCQFIGTVIETVVDRPKDTIVTRSDKLDKVVTHKIWAANLPAVDMDRLPVHSQCQCAFPGLGGFLYE